MRISFAAGLLALTLVAVPALAQEPTPAPAAASTATTQFTPAQRTEIEGVIKQYIHDNPQIIVEALNAMQEQMRAEEAAAQASNIRENHAKIYDPAGLPVAGNPNGDVTIVEFFDYKCGYCRAMHPVVQQLLQDDKNVRLIYKEFPILGPTSVQASQVAMAANAQGKYLEMHNKLMSSDTRVEASNFMKIAESLGLDMARFTKDMSSQDMMVNMRDNLELTSTLGIRGTPAFIIGDKLYPGAMNMDQLKQAVKDARDAAKNPSPKPAAP